MNNSCLLLMNPFIFHETRKKTKQSESQVKEWTFYRAEFMNEICTPIADKNLTSQEGH